MVSVLAVMQLTLATVALEPAAPVPLVRADDSQPVLAATPIKFGAAFDVGLPSGLELAPYVRPLEWLQLDLALGHDGAAFGLGGGLTLGALESSFTPTLSVDAGHFFRGDLSGKLGAVTGLDLSKYTWAKQFDFDHVEAQAGVLFGWPNVRFYVRAGVSYLHATLHDFSASLQAATHDTTLTAADPTLTAIAPSARAGMMVSF